MSLKDAIKKIRPTIFQIQIQIHNPSALPNNQPLGTAFAISEQGHLVTALHVITAGEQFLAENAGNGRLLAAVAGEKIDREDMQIMASFSGSDFEVIAKDEENDLALLKLPVSSIGDLAIRTGGEDGPEVRPRPATLLISRPDDGEKIATSGYPFGEPSLVTNAGHIANNWTIIPGSYECYLGDLTTNPGNSGGPVYRLSDAKVLGVLTAGRLSSVLNAAGQPTGMQHSVPLAVIVPAYTVKQFLDQNGVAV